MQKPTVMAFRKRLKNRGYEDIRICKTKESGIYYVSAVEPLSEDRVESLYSLAKMNRKFR